LKRPYGKNPITALQRHRVQLWTQVATEAGLDRPLARAAALTMRGGLGVCWVEVLRKQTLTNEIGDLVKAEGIKRMRSIIRRCLDQAEYQYHAGISLSHVVKQVQPTDVMDGGVDS